MVYWLKIMPKNPLNLPKKFLFTIVIKEIQNAFVSGVFSAKVEEDILMLVIKFAEEVLFDALIVALKEEHVVELLLIED